MFDWTTPVEGAGCYCVRGTVTDAASQTTVVVAAKPVRFSDPRGRRAPALLAGF
jgi:hypothetical protein